MNCRCTAIITLTLSTIVRIHHAFGQNDRVINTALGIDGQMLENIIEYLLLILVVCDNVSIELRSQLISHSLDVHDVVANLNWLHGRHFGIFLLLLFAWLGDQVAKAHQRCVVACPTNAALVRTLNCKKKTK